MIEDTHRHARKRERERGEEEEGGGYPTKNIDKFETFFKKIGTHTKQLAQFAKHGEKDINDIQQCVKEVEDSR